MKNPPQIVTDFNYPPRTIDTSWMSEPQMRFFNIIINNYKDGMDYKYYLKLSGYSNSSTWYRAINDERFLNLIKSLGLKIKKFSINNPKHTEVEFIKDYMKRNEYLNNDIWDVRYLYVTYPRHVPPSKFIINFATIDNEYVKKTLKKYARCMLSSWKPLTTVFNCIGIISFFEVLLNVISDFEEFKYLLRSDIELTISTLTFSNYKKRNVLKSVKQMFNYMYANRWDDAPDANLITSYDIPNEDNRLPRPIPPNILTQLDDYLNKVIPLLEEGKPTPIIEPCYWDAILILRYTGRRTDDLCHLLADNGENDCLKYDNDNDPQLFLEHSHTKIPKDLYIPLAHLNNHTPYGNVVERAILRQKERVFELPPVNDDKKYLFREKKRNGDIEVLDYSKLNKRVLAKVCKSIPLVDYDNKSYIITPHQFRHTVATEMIDAGVDIYAVKEFLGHEAITMTEQYIKIYNERIKKEFKRKLSISNATEIVNNLPQVEENYDGTWVKNRLIGILELGDGCCEHIYKMPSCPHMSCKTCFKKKIYPRHMNAVKNTIESYTVHYENAKSLGLIEKANEFKEIVNFYTKALEYIKKGIVFEASKHYYGEIKLCQEIHDQTQTG